MTLLDDRTKLSLALVIALLGIVATGGVVWGKTASELTAVKHEVSSLIKKDEAKESRLKENEVTQRHMLEILREIKQDVKEIKRGR